MFSLQVKSVLTMDVDLCGPHSCHAEFDVRILPSEHSLNQYPEILISPHLNHIPCLCPN